MAKNFLWIRPFFHLQPFQPWDMPACFHMQEVFQSGLFNNTPFSFPSFFLVPLSTFESGSPTNFWAIFSDQKSARQKKHA